MFDIGFPELLLVAVVMLLVLGPERLPEALRTAGLWIGRLQRSFNSVKTEIEREIGMDDIRRQLHNESVMAEMRKLEQDLKTNADPRLNGKLKGSVDSNDLLPEDSLGLGTEVDDPGVAKADTASSPAAAANTEPAVDNDAASAPAVAAAESEPEAATESATETEAETVERLQREAAASHTAEADSANGGSESSDEQRA